MQVRVYMQAIESHRHTGEVDWTSVAVAACIGFVVGSFGTLAGWIIMK